MYVIQSNVSSLKMWHIDRRTVFFLESQYLKEFKKGCYQTSTVSRAFYTIIMKQKRPKIDNSSISRLDPNGDSGGGHENATQKQEKE